MKNYKIDGIGAIVEIGNSNAKLRGDASDQFSAITNDETGLARVQGADPVNAQDFVTKNYYDNAISPETIFSVALGSSDLMLFDKTSFTKCEVEYAFALDSVDKIQLGRVTFLWDGIDAIITSDEIEDSGNLGQITSVTYDAYFSGNDVGIRFNNTSGEVFDFKYIAVNKFNVVYTPNPTGLLQSFSNVFYDTPNKTLSNGNLTLTGTLGSNINEASWGYMNKGIPLSGKYYIEFKLDAAPNGVTKGCCLGYFVGSSELTPETTGSTEYYRNPNLVASSTKTTPFTGIGGTASILQMVRLQCDIDQIIYDSSSLPATQSIVNVGDVIGLAIDFDNDRIFHSINGVYRDYVPTFIQDPNVPASGLNVAALNNSYGNPTPRAWIGASCVDGQVWSVKLNGDNVPVNYTYLL